MTKSKKLSPLEAQIERRFVQECIDRGGIAIKLDSSLGIPDRLAVLPFPNGAYYVFIEFKKIGGRVAKAQKIWGKKLKGLKCRHFIMDKPEEVDSFFAAYEHTVAREQIRTTPFDALTR